jgi:murein DD-endopeptidase MepM/ murein hydrolase activator NlpD
VKQFHSNLFILCCVIIGVAQYIIVNAAPEADWPMAPASLFQPPVDYELSLAGNFGEPRPNHFHGGLDVRTEGVQGKHIYAVSDGYVSRVSMGLYGFGNAVYITHPTGQTSVYCHLKAFSPRIKAALRKFQYAHRTCVADAYLSPLDVPVSRGQFIAISGNTGYSKAPHLHLELHDTRTWNMLDPYPYFYDFIEDTVPPQAHSFMAVPIDGVFDGSTRQQTFSHQRRGLTAWGKVGFAVWADDYMQNAYNHYGIHETQLVVDGQVVFHSLVDNIPARLNRMVNAWGNYDHYLRHRTWYMKSYLEPGNILPCIETDASRGIVDFKEERDYHLDYMLRDYKDNERHYLITVRGEQRSIPAVPAVKAVQPMLRWNRTNSYSIPGIQLMVPYGYVFNDVALSPRVLRRPEGYSDVYSFTSQSHPLMYDAPLSIYVRRKVAVPSKLYLTDENKHFLGGDYHEGWLTGSVRDLASRYEVAYDDQVPDIRPVSMGQRLVLHVTDAQSGVGSWTAAVDGRFIVFDAIEKTSSYACDLRETWLKRTGKQHHLKFTATDNRNNSQTYETNFVY